MYKLQKNLQVYKLFYMHIGVSVNVSELISIILSVKVCEKRHIIREKKQQYVKREKEVLMLLSVHLKESAPFFVRLFCTFQDDNSLCKFYCYLPVFINTIYLSSKVNFSRFCFNTSYKW